MKNARPFMYAFLTAVLCMGILAPLLSASNNYTMVGKISAIDSEYNTVVIDVPLSNGQVFTIGGPLAQNAVLKKGDKPASLKDFNVGEKVWVKWRSYENGHIIEVIKAEK